MRLKPAFWSAGLHHCVAQPHIMPLPGSQPIAAGHGSVLPERDSVQTQWPRLVWAGLGWGGGALCGSLPVRVHRRPSVLHRQQRETYQASSWGATHTHHQCKRCDLCDKMFMRLLSTFLGTPDHLLRGYHGLRLTKTAPTVQIPLLVVSCFCSLSTFNFWYILQYVSGHHSLRKWLFDIFYPFSLTSHMFLQSVDYSEVIGLHQHDFMHWAAAT